MFGGSSQWHYRERIPRPHKDNFCHLVFLHFVPAGAGHLTHASKWAEHFGLPELANLIVRQRDVDTTVIG